MNAVTLFEQVHLVGSGNAGFDLTDPLDCHVYLIDGADSWAVIDAGSGNDSGRIIDNMLSTGIDFQRPGALLLTHGHADHSGGAGDLRAAFPSLSVWAGAPVGEWIMSGNTQAISLDRGKASGAYPETYTYRACSNIRVIADAASIELGGCSIEAIRSPGHADGHFCYVLRLPDSRLVLFSGDCVFTRGRVSIQNLHDVSIPAHAHTISKLNSLGIDALLPGHYSLSLSDASRHIAAAHAAFTAGRIPANAP